MTVGRFVVVVVVDTNRSNTSLAALELPPPVVPVFVPLLVETTFPSRDNHNNCHIVACMYSSVPLDSHPGVS
jgi:hypothetical protein